MKLSEQSDLLKEQIIKLSKFYEKEQSHFYQRNKAISEIVQSLNDIHDELLKIRNNEAKQ